jgi:hypothetical protein
MKMPKVGDIVVVEWFDHFRNDEFARTTDLKDEGLLVNVGQVVRLTDRIMTLGHSYDSESGFRSTSIYRSLIRRVDIIRCVRRSRLEVDE